jgi:hypothetical protein
MSNFETVGRGCVGEIFLLNKSDRQTPLRRIPSRTDPKDPSADHQYLKLSLS